jgi:hypothetical protein
MPREETMSSFSVDLAKFGQKAIDNSEKIVRKIAFDMHRKIVERTPVDTGRAKANNQISVGSVPSSTTESKDTTPLGQAGAGTLSAANISADKFKLGDTIFLYNNVEYILSLEYGHSKQAPAGMFRITFEEVVQHLGGVAA